jgi:hypothetical protein
VTRKPPEFTLAQHDALLARLAAADSKRLGRRAIDKAEATMRRLSAQARQEHRAS